MGIGILDTLIHPLRTNVLYIEYSILIQFILIEIYSEDIMYIKLCLIILSVL